MVAPSILMSMGRELCKTLLCNGLTLLFFLYGHSKIKKDGCDAYYDKVHFLNKKKKELFFVPVAIIFLIN